VDSLVSRVGRKIGVRFPASRKQAVASAIQRVMLRRGLEDVADLVGRIGLDEDLTDEVVTEVTVGETYFFRDPAQFDVIRTMVIPALLSQRPEHAAIRIWSAGCSTGEEPYSLAIAMEEDGLADRARIVATDISREALSTARGAEYGEWSLRNGGMDLLGRYFCRRGDRFQLNRRLARRVRFVRHRLGADKLPSPADGIVDLDLILCRNVLMYLEPAAVKRIAGQLFDCLADGGWLLAGPSDPQLWEHARFETSVTPAGVMYRRNTAAARVGAEPARSGSAVPRPATPDLKPRPDLPHQHGRPRPAAKRSQRRPRTRAAESFARHIRLLRRGDDLGAAAAVASEAVKRHPLSAELHYLQSLGFISEARIDEAAAALRRVIYLDRTLAAAHFLLGSCLRDSDAEAALRAFENALALCAARPADEPVPLMADAVAGRLADRARQQIAALKLRLGGRS
jgi:chemotaxis protein methyltransferase CheR